jgi:integrase
MSIESHKTKQGKVRYEVRLRTASGREYSRTFRTRKEAERFEATEVADRARGTWIDPRRAETRFARVAADWLTSHPSKKESSLARDQSVVNGHLIPALGDVPIGQITQADVQRLVNTWATHLAPRTVRRHYAVLRAILTLAVDSERILRSPCRKIKLPEEPPVRHHIVTPDELADLASALGQDDASLLDLAAITGLRWGECAGLRVADIDFLGRSLTVATQRTRGLGGRMVSSDPKWHSVRTIAVPGELLELLGAHLRKRGLTGGDVAEPVFVAPDGKPLHYSNWRRRVWVPACAKAAFPT